MTLSMSMQVISTARTCNCILIVLDAIKPITHKRLIEKELEGFGIRFVLLFLFYLCACGMPILFLKNQLVHCLKFAAHGKCLCVNWSNTREVTFFFPAG